MAFAKLARGLALCALLFTVAAQDVSSQQGGSSSIAAAPSQAMSSQQGAMAPSSAMAPSQGDIDVLNLALQLSYLEAAFYNQAAFGRAVPDELRGGGPAASGGKKGAYTPQVEALAQELAQTSLAHVRVLRDILGNSAAPMPAINLDTAWQQLANSALNTQLQPAFDPYANDLFFSLAVNQLEGLSVSAFRGMSSMINANDFNSIVAGILGAEAYYDGAIRWRLSDRLAVVTAWQQPLWRVVNAFATLRANLSSQAGQAQAGQQQQIGQGQQQQAGQGQQQFDIGILQPVAQSSLAQAPNPRTFAGGNAVQIAAVDPSNGLVYSRTPAQVLAVLYGSGDASKPGLFFPQGVNGNLKG